MSRLRLVLCGGLAVLLAACGGDITGPASRAPRPPARDAAPAPRPGTTGTTGATGSSSTLDATLTCTLTLDPLSGQVLVCQTTAGSQIGTGSGG